MNTLFMHCRPGFEGEVCSEIAEHAARLNVSGYAKAKTGSAARQRPRANEPNKENAPSGWLRLRPFRRRRRAKNRLCR